MNKGLSKKEIYKKIRRVDDAMAQEGMPLTKQIKKTLYNCITGKSTVEIEIEKVINKYKKKYK